MRELLKDLALIVGAVLTAIVTLTLVGLVVYWVINE